MTRAPVMCQSIGASAFDGKRLAQSEKPVETSFHVLCLLTRFGQKACQVFLQQLIAVQLEAFMQSMSFLTKDKGCDQHIAQIVSRYDAKEK